jgi:pimeloyl-ACP methyl ester carboxylesterase
VHCSAGAAASGPPPPVPDPVPQDDAARQSLFNADTAFANACGQYSHDLLPFVGTADAARDLDRIRAAIGDNALTFLGHSYGTLLGLTYADEFPSRVRALVLDGTIDPALSLDDMSLAQAQGFDSSLNAFFQWCQANSGGCAWHPGGDPEGTMMAMLSSTRSHPLPGGGGRTVGPGEFYLGVLATLYAQSFWPSLGRALGEAANGSGSQLLALSDGYQRNGSANAADANTAVTCADHPASRDPSTYPARARAAGQHAPVFGPLFAWGALSCGTWTVPASRTPHDIHAPGAPPILVVGTTADPATPYAWAVRAASKLDRGVLVGRRGVDHVAYYYSSCVRSIDARYLIDGITPPTGTMCD